MKIVVTALVASLMLAAPAMAKPPELKSQEDKISYAIGISVGRNLKQQEIQVKPDVFLAGVRASLDDEKPALSDEEMRAAIAALQEMRHKKQVESMQKASEENKKEGAAFLAANKKKKGVQTTKSGLQYQVLKAGTGKAPSLENTVSAHYRGTLINGKEFDSSYARGQPAEFPVRGVIPGWTEVLQLMKEGAKYQVWIPAELAYGERGAGQLIGPHATLIFEIELLAVK